MSVDPDLLETGAGDREILVLHVDDDPGQTDLAKTYLERASETLSVRACNCVSAGLDVLETAPVDCVVSDYQMPGLDGLELLERVRRRDPDLPFVLFTGKGSEEIASEAISAGVSEYLQKGVGSDQYEVLANRVRNVVANHRARAALDRSNALFRRLFQAGTDALVIRDLDRERFLAANDEVRTLLGYDPGEVLDWDGLGDLFSPGVDWRAMLATVRETGEDRVECRCPHAEGHAVPVELSATTIDVEETSLLVLSLRDLTSWKERERDLGAMYQAIEHAGHSIYRTDPDGTITYVNPAFEETTGYSEEAALGETPAILNSGVHDDAYWESLWETILDGEVWRNRVVNETAEGETYVVDQTIAPVEADGEIREFVAVNAEVTPAQAHGADEGVEYRRLVAEAPVPMVLADAETGRITGANAAAADLFERSQDDLVGMHQSALHPDAATYERLFRTHHDQAAADETSRTVRTELEDGTRIEIVTGAGDRKPVAISATPVALPDGPGFLGAFVEHPDSCHSDPLPS